MQNKLFATMITALLLLLMAGSAMCATTYDSNVTLENKDGNPDWNEVPDGISAVIEYNSVGEEFAWYASGIAPVKGVEYSLIYYADYEDRFNNWGGDNPGALIGTMMTDAGTGAFSEHGYTELGMDLPMTPDANMDIHDYSGAPDNYTNAHGAKLWMVPSDEYDAVAKKVIKWNVEKYLFETDLITYEDCGGYYTQDVPANATFSIVDVFNTETVSIMILDATNAGAVDITLTYNASVVEITGIANGDMDAMFKNEGVGTVRIGAYQADNPGLDGDFVLVNVSFAHVGDGSCDSDSFGITVTTYKDATPCGRSMPYIVDTGIYCSCLNGDVNCDDDVDMFDVMYIAKHSIGISGFENICECAADVDGSGNVDIADASRLAGCILGKEGYCPLE